MAGERGRSHGAGAEWRTRRTSGVRFVGLHRNGACVRAGRAKRTRVAGGFLENQTESCFGCRLPHGCFDFRVHFLLLKHSLKIQNHEAIHNVHIRFFRDGRGEDFGSSPEYSFKSEWGGVYAAAGEKGVAIL